jgi:dienelactone hydrolase
MVKQEEDRDVLAAYERFEFRAGRFNRTVYRRGKGPAVIVIHELPGLHPQVVTFADRLVEAGLSVYLPVVFGKAGKPLDPVYAVATAAWTICVRHEFAAWAANRSSPIVDWLRALARRAHEEKGGPGVGAIGMCFTGNFALAMMTEPAVIAPVMAQPSMPLGESKRSKAGLGCSPEEVACARRRLTEMDGTLIGLRFRGDSFVPEERFASLRAALGDRFEAIELDPEDAKQGTGMAPHSPLTIHQRGTGPTKAAEARVVSFFQRRLGL